MDLDLPSDLFDLPNVQLGPNAEPAPSLEAQVTKLELDNRTLTRQNHDLKSEVDRLTQNSQCQTLRIAKLEADINQHTQTIKTMQESALQSVQSLAVFIQANQAVREMAQFKSEGLPTVFSQHLQHCGAIFTSLGSKVVALEDKHQTLHKGVRMLLALIPPLREALQRGNDKEGEFHAKLKELSNFYASTAEKRYQETSQIANSLREQLRNVTAELQQAQMKYDQDIARYYTNYPVENTRDKIIESYRKKLQKALQEKADMEIEISEIRSSLASRDVLNP